MNTTTKPSADIARDIMLSEAAQAVLRTAANALKWGTITVEIKDSRPVMTRIHIDTKN
jgi:hypothetical protein